MANQSYEILLQKLDAFIRKYYKNQLIRGFLYSLTFSTVLFLFVSALEYWGNFNITVRTALFYSFILGNLAIFVRFIFIPLAKLYKIGSVISHAQAAEIIGNHFTEVKDKLINVLQLQQLAQEAVDSDLVMAGIDQKTAELRPVPFTSAINLRENLRYAKIAAIPLAAIFALLGLYPAIFTEGTQRLMAHNTHFEPQAPFRFNIKNTRLQAIQNEDFTLSLQLEGAEIPQEVYIDIDGRQYKLQQDGKTTFTYVFKSPQESLNFRLFADGYFSKAYTLEVVPKPTLLHLEMSLVFPKYLGMKDEIIQNQGDVTVPQGTRIKWSIKTKNTKNLAVILPDTSFTATIVKDAYSFEQKLMKNLQYGLMTSNEFIQGADSVGYTIQVIPDIHPSIEVAVQKDSIFVTRLYFKGGIKDDYGFKKLAFHYERKSADGKKLPRQSITIPFQGIQTQQSFFHYFDVKTLNLAEGEEVEYYFEVWDNDGVNGSKSARTASNVYVLPTQKEISEKVESNNTQIKSDLNESLEQAKELQKSLEDFRKQMMQKKELNWQDKKRLEDLIQQQKNLEEQINKTKELNEKNNLQKNELSEQEQSILDKQKKIEEMLDELMNEDLKKQLEELEKIMEKLDKNKLQEMMDKMQLSNQDLEKELDRTLELFKQMEVEQKLDQLKENLKNLAEKQEELAKKTQEGKENKDKLLQEQEKLNKEFEDFQKEMKELEKMNEQLEQPNDLKMDENLDQEISQEQNKAKEDIKDNQQKKASQAQKNAAQKMKEKQKQMEEMQAAMQSDQASENMEDLRQLLDNLLKLSFDQERVMEDLKKTSSNNPQYKDLVKEQKKLVDDSKIIEDSLLALSKRMIELESFVNKEMTAIKSNMKKSVEFLADRQVPVASQKQQYAMTSINNLALMLSEALEQMQQQMMKQSGQRSGSCTKPGSSMPQQGKLSERQMGMQKKLDEMMKKMQGGQKPGDQKGKGGGEGQNGELSKDLVKMAAEQEQIRKELQKLAESLTGEQKKLAEDAIKKMEENERDILNKRITQQTINRQNEIQVRLLESEKAEREQEKDEKRESNENKQDKPLQVKELEEYFKKKQQEIELLKTVPPAMRPYYRNKVNEYFNKF